LPFFNRSDADSCYSTTTPSQISEISKSFEAKQSLDIDGISLKFPKFVAVGISVPLAHVFNQSLNSGIFPEKIEAK
jgi:hypothetical protein